MSTTGTFGDTCTKWGQTCNIWSQCIAAVVEEIYGGARNPQEWGDGNYGVYEDQQKALLAFQEKNPHRRSVLIDIFIKCANKKYKRKLEFPTKDIFLKIEDVKFIMNTMKEIGVDVKNIKRYSDEDLNNLLS